MLHAQLPRIPERGLRTVHRAAAGVGAFGAPALELSNHTGEAVGDVVFVGSQVKQVHLDLVDEGIEKVEVAEVKRGVADDDIRLVDDAERGGKAELQELGDDETGILDDFGRESVGLGLESHGRSVKQDLAVPKAEFER